MDDFKNALAIVASVSTIVQFLAGTLVCQSIVQKKSTGDSSSLPFVCGFLSTTLWLRYGFLIQDVSLILVNTIGSTLHVGYVIVFYLYSIKKSMVFRQFMCGVATVSFVVAYSVYQDDRDAVARHVGFLCCLTTVLFFAAPLASLVHVVKMKSTESLPFPIILMTLIVSLQWFIYGVLLHDAYIQIPNLLGCILSAFQLSLYFIYPRITHHKPGNINYSPVTTF